MSEDQFIYFKYNNDFLHNYIKLNEIRRDTEKKSNYWARPIKASNLMCEIGMSIYQYWHQVMRF